MFGAETIEVDSTLDSFVTNFAFLCNVGKWLLKTHMHRHTHTENTRMENDDLCVLERLSSPVKTIGDLKCDLSDGIASISGTPELDKS